MTDKLTPERKIDKLQFQMESVQTEIKELKNLSRETNSKLDTMSKGFVGREEYREFQKLVAGLASKEELAVVSAQVKELKDWQTWAIRIALGVVIVAGITALIATR